jgi:glycosyltransferase involved in cell wall biosynthesis
VLWVNDVTYGPLIARTGWPSLYDVTDDWLLAAAPARELARLRRLEARTLSAADEVVVCSPSLAGTRGASRPVTLIPNGVDVEHFTRRQARPADLPPSPVAVYVGTLHDERVDVDLIVELAGARPELHIALVGPDALSARSRTRLLDCPGVALLGPRAHVLVPGYLQHADVIVVPHLVTPFTDSLDPIKAYECLAVERPTVATDVAGFKGHGEDGMLAVPRGDFVACVARALDDRPGPGRRWPSSAGEHDWAARCAAMEDTLLRLG